MSLSSQQRSGAWGTIFMGPGAAMETTLEKVEAGGPSLAWTVGTEAEYLDRVRAKATAKAKEILRAAQAEADALRGEAQARGYDDGLAQAQGELEEFRQNMGASVDAVLAAIEGGAGRIAEAWRAELVSLTRSCVEAAVGHELSNQKVELLGALFDGAVRKMAGERRISILVSPDDAPVVADMLDAAGRSEDKTFSVTPDPSLEPGSLVLESDDSRVDNSLTVRRRMVENILAGLSIPEDRPAAAEVTTAPAAAPAPQMPQAPQEIQAQEPAAEAPEMFAAAPEILPEPVFIPEAEAAQAPEIETALNAVGLEAETTSAPTPEVELESAGAGLEAEPAPEAESAMTFETEILPEAELAAEPEIVEAFAAPEAQEAAPASEDAPAAELSDAAAAEDLSLAEEPALSDEDEEQAQAEAAEPGQPAEAQDPFELAQALIDKTQE